MRNKAATATAPAKADLKELRIRRSNRPDYKHTITELMICRLDENSPRVEKLDFRLKPAQKGAGRKGNCRSFRARQDDSAGGFRSDRMRPFGLLLVGVEAAAGFAA